MSQQDLVENLVKTIDFGGQKQNLLTVYSIDTWGSFGQYAKVMVFYLHNNRFEPAWTDKKVVWQNNDSRKNRHRIAMRDISTLEGRIIKIISDTKTSGKKYFRVQYYKISAGDIQRLESSTFGSTDVVILADGTMMRVTKDRVVFE